MQLHQLDLDTAIKLSKKHIRKMHPGKKIWFDYFAINCVTHEEGLKADLKPYFQLSLKYRVEGQIDQSEWTVAL